MPCNSSQYLYWNNTCRDSCSPPLQIKADTRQCIYPCNKAYGQFLYSDGSCLPTCPLIQRNESGYAFCDNCSPSYYFYPEDGQCKLGCTYPYAILNFVYCELDLSHQDKEEVVTMANIAGTSKQTMTIGSLVMGLFTSGDPSAFASIALVNMLLYTRYINVKFSPKLQSVLDHQDISQSSIEPLKKVQSSLKASHKEVHAIREI